MALFGWFSKQNSRGENTITDEDARQIVDEFNQSSNTIQEIPEVLENISFDEVIDYFKNYLPENPSFGQAAIICKEHGEGTFFAQVFLDENNKLICLPICLPSGAPLGRQFVAKNMDKKLSEFLGDRDLNLVDLRQFVAEDVDQKSSEFLGDRENFVSLKPKSIVIKSIKTVGIILWILVVLLVLLPLLGRLIMNQALAAELNSSPPLEITQNMVAFGNDDKKAFDKARNIAYKDAKQYAKQELDQWEYELIDRIDTDFLDWYFNYFVQKKQELDVLLQYVGEMLITGFNQSIVDDRIKDRINANISRQFSRLVISPESAESQFKNIVIETTEMYLEKLSLEINNVPIRYKINPSDWNQYLETIKVRLENEKGNEFLPVEIIGGSYMASKIAAAVAAKAGSKVAAGFVSSQVAAIIDPLAAVALLGLDYWDYTNGVAQNKPRLREDLVQSLHQIKKTLLNDPESGVMSAVNELDEKIRNSI